ncbi:MAG: TolC family protein [Spirochaetaceae bacterium]|nr:TolC family protein [Spirochaetaceae bacterium]
MKKTKIFKFLISIFLTITISFSAVAITLDDALNMAYLNNNSLKSQRISLETAQREAQAKWNIFLPSITVGGGLTNKHFSDNSSNTWNWNAQGGISLSLTAGIPARLEKAALAYELAKNTYQTTEQNIAKQVVSSFYNLIAEAQNISILEDSLDLSKRQYEQTKRNYNNGLASELSLLQAQYAYLSSEPVLEKARTTYQTNLKSFQTLLGSSEQIIPEGELLLNKLNLPSSNELIDKYLENRLDVIKNKITLEQAKNTKKMQGLDSLSPSVNLSENLNLSPSNNIASSDKKFSPSGTFSVSVSIPVDAYIPGSSKNLALKSLDDNISIAQISLDTVKTQAKQDIESNINNINQLWNTINIAELNLSITNRAYQLSKESYNAGLISQTDLDESRQQMITARQNVINSKSTYIVSVFNLATSLNIQVSELIDLFTDNNTKN